METVTRVGPFLLERHRACSCSICREIGARQIGILLPECTAWNAWRWIYLGSYRLRWAGFWKRKSAPAREDRDE